MRSVLSVVFLVCVSFGLACKTDALSVGGDGGAPDAKKNTRVPLVHRPTAESCPTARPAVNCGGGSPGSTECQSDADCVDASRGTNGRCVGGGHGICGCSYDACVNDSECDANQLCNCRTAPSTLANSCLTTNCRTDDECGENYCSPSLDPTCGAFFGITAWHCHTTKDKCVDDADCNDPSAYCAYFPELGHWQCSTSQCAG